MLKRGSWWLPWAGRVTTEREGLGALECASCAPGVMPMDIGEAMGDLGVL